MTKWQLLLLTPALSYFLCPVSPAADLPKTSAAPADIATNDYRLGPEDVIDVFVWKEPQLTTTVVVRPDGKISLPLADELTAAGKTAPELRLEITEKLARYLQSPVVNVMVKQVNSQTISVLGEVRRPDVYRINTRMTVLEAIALAGGFTDLARPSRVVVLRDGAAGKQERFRINVEEMISDHDGRVIYLQPRDTVYVEGR